MTIATLTPVFRCPLCGGAAFAPYENKAGSYVVCETRGCTFRASTDWVEGYVYCYERLYPMLRFAMAEYIGDDPKTLRAYERYLTSKMTT